MSTEIRSVQTSRAPAAIGPYSQAVCAGGFVFVSGQIALDPETGSLVEGGFGAQMEQVMLNLQAVLEAAGSSLEHVVKFTCFVTDLAQFGSVNNAFTRHLKAPFPARATIEVSGLPKGALVELEAVAAGGCQEYER
jgi:2-iminobutanoate/2-iminopropanoate deaminase